MIDIPSPELLLHHHHPRLGQRERHLYVYLDLPFLPHRYCFHPHPLRLLGPQHPRQILLLLPQQLRHRRNLCELTVSQSIRFLPERCLLVIDPSLCLCSQTSKKFVRC